MEARYAFRKSQLLDDCQIAPEIFEQVIPRLYTFMEPFVKTFQGQAAEQHAKIYVCGLLSDVERKNIESIAYRFGRTSGWTARRIPWSGSLAAFRVDVWPSNAMPCKGFVKLLTALPDENATILGEWQKQ